MASPSDLGRLTNNKTMRINDVGQSTNNGAIQPTNIGGILSTYIRSKAYHALQRME